METDIPSHLRTKITQDVFQSETSVVFQRYGLSSLAHSCVCDCGNRLNPAISIFEPNRSMIN